MAIRSASDIHGVYVALFTPLREDDPKRLRNSIDYDKAAKMIDDLVAVGVQGIIPVGTTGQSATVSHRQHLDFIKFAVEHVDGRVDVIAGAGSNCTRESIEMIEEVEKIAEVPVLCVTGYYNNPTQEGIREHFRTLARETGAKIVMYTVPGRTASYIAPETVLELAEEPNVIGLKQAVNFKPGGDRRDDTLKIAEGTRGKDFALLTGEDDAIVDVMELGGRGVVTATGNIPEAAALMLKTVEACEKGDWQRGRELQRELEPFVKATFCCKNPIPMGLFFNSPLFQPMSDIRSCALFANQKAQCQELIDTLAPSLRQYR